MATLAAPIPVPPADARWLHGRTYDLTWYVLMAPALFLALAGLSTALGPQGPLVAYFLTATFTGLPHNAITWLLTMPAHSRGYYAPGAMFGPLIVSALVLAPTVFLFGTPAFAWALTLNIVVAYYHITRQHMGVLFSADGRYVQATGDRTIAAETADLRLAVGLFATAAILWKMTGPPMLLGLGKVQFPFMLWPLPWPLAAAATAALAWFAARWAWRTARRVRAGQAFPALQAAMAAGAVMNLGLAAIVPNDQFLLTLALVGSFHNAQYFAFCYTHHHLRATADPAAQDPFSRLARGRRWFWWFATPVLAGLGYVAIAATLPPFWNAAVLNAAMISHYFVDATIWRRKYYPRMAEFGRAAVAPAGPAELVVTVPAAGPAGPAGSPAAGADGPPAADAAPADAPAAGTGAAG